MRVIKVLEHRGTIYCLGDKVELILRDGNKVIGSIRDFGNMRTKSGIIYEGVVVNTRCIPLDDIISAIRR